MKIPNLVGQDSLGILLSLLPGLLTYLVHHSLCHRGRKIEAVPAVLWGLAYTLIVHALWTCLKAMGSVIPTPDVVGLPLTAVAAGIGFSALSTSGFHYNLLRRLRVTHEGSDVSIWLTTLRIIRHERRGYVTIGLRDGRFVAGGLFAFSAEDLSGHITLMPYAWLIDGKPGEWVSELLMLKESDIEFVESYGIKETD